MPSPAARRVRTFAIVGVASAHALVFAILGLNAPQGRWIAPLEDISSWSVVVDLARPPPRPERVERVHTQAPAPTPTPTPTQPRPRLAAPVQGAPPVEALPMAPAPGPPPAPASPVDLSKALRGSRIGCANAGTAGLSQRQIEACQERLGDGAKTAPFLPAAIGVAKRKEFDAIAEQKKRDREWREAPVPVGTQPSDTLGGPAGLGSTER